jgi:hypothetical protein
MSNQNNVPWKIFWLNGDSIDPEVKKEIEVAEQDALGGFLRSLSKSVPTFVKTMRSATSSSIKKIPLKTVTNTADRLGTAVDMWNHYEQGKEANRKQISKWQLFVKAFPPFFKSSLLGAGLFEVYDYSKVKLNVHTHDIYFIPKTIFISTISGAFHGCMFISWEWTEKHIYKLMHKTNSTTISSSTSNIPYIPSGLLLSHTITHGSLFCTYEISKLYLLQQLQRHHPNEKCSPIEEMSCIFTAGTMAALVSESIAHYAACIEEKGLVAGMKEIVNIQRPKSRHLLPLTLPPALGFLAYEHEKTTL